MQRTHGAAGIVAGLLCCQSLVGQDRCWDNDLEPNGLGGRPTSPPEFPDHRVTDDFVVGGEETWLVCGVHSTHVEDDGWTPGTVIEVFIYDDGGKCPGDLIATKLTTDFTRQFEGYQLFDRDVYTYRVNFECVELDPGVYHVGTRFPNAGGGGGTYWITSDGGAGTERPGCYSLDRGATWIREGAGGHRAFELTGDCDGGTRGACCFEDGSCRELTGDLCETAGGLYRGDGVACEDADCAQPPTGACCFEQRHCEELEIDECVRQGGQYQGDGTSCAEACPPVGACCFVNSSCGIRAEADCVEVFGTYRGDGTTCADIDCRDDLCWDNGIVPDGSNWARAISPPAYPDIRVADDFTIPEGETWTMLDVRFHVLEDASWESNGVITLFLYEDRLGHPGKTLLALDTGFEQTFMGVFFSRDTYTYFLDPVEIRLGEGHYWLGIRNGEATGSGTSYWGSGDGAGRDGPGSHTGCFSLDAGKTWMAEGAGWQHAFQIRGICGCPKCPPDFDGDCDVGFADLLVLLSAWGPCSPNHDCFDQDLDGNGAVEFDDLLLLLASWGSCEG